METYLTFDDHNHNRGQFVKLQQYDNMQFALFNVCEQIFVLHHRNSVFSWKMANDYWYVSAFVSLQRRTDSTILLLVFLYHIFRLNNWVIVIQRPGCNTANYVILIWFCRCRRNSNRFPQQNIHMVLNYNRGHSGQQHLKHTHNMNDHIYTVETDRNVHSWTYDTCHLDGRQKLKQSSKRDTHSTASFPGQPG